MTAIKQKIRAVPFKRWLQYVLFWGISVLILSRYFAYQNEVSSIDVIYTILFHISLLCVVCINSFFLIPGFLAKQKYIIYAIFLIITLVVGTWINIYTFRYLADWLFPGFYFISYLNWTNIIQFLIVYVGITTLLQLSRSWFRESEIKQELAEAKKEQAEVELKALRAQLNPHFLFNSLNHIYSLAVQQSPKTAPAILQLSDLLRYAIRNMNNKKVELSKEIDYIKKYVNLYKSRVKHPERINLTISESDNSFEIAPLLLIVFIENCFKHGSVKNEEEEISIEVTITEGSLVLCTRNHVDVNRELPSESTGIGLENAQKRLKLLYPDKHTLEVQSDDLTYTTNLTIELQ
ncbi:MAG: histidine kinase [Balneolaceae bacterium]|nr:histidine kinase [Balneolaceae bacterium]